MPECVTMNGHTQIIVPLTIMPYSHQALPTLTGSPFSREAGTVLFGHYNMEYLLPGGDRLRLIANHNKKTVQFMLFTHQPELIRLLPGKRPSSLVADSISTLHRYRIRSASYTHPLTSAQVEKLRIVEECIASLQTLLKEERRLKKHEYKGQQRIRKKAIELIGQCSDQNRMLAINPLVSEGYLGDLLYDAHKAAGRYKFNRAYSVSRQDQMDFSQLIYSPNESEEPNCLVWDSEVHIGHDSKELDDALRVLCSYYKIPPAASLSDVPANRLAKLAAFFAKLWKDGHDWINYLAMNEKPEHKTEEAERLDGVKITKITPYYKLQGFPQTAYPDLNTLISDLTHSVEEPITAKTIKKAKNAITKLAHGHWAVIPRKHLVLIRLENKLVQLRYFVHDGLFYPMPDGQDLYALGQISKRHLYLPERVRLRLYAFFSQIPHVFNKFYKSMKGFILHDLYEDFVRHVHNDHNQMDPEHRGAKEHRTKHSKYRNSLIRALEHNGFLTNGQTLEEFINEHITHSPYLIARPDHPPSPPAYDNPFHRALDVLRHVAGFFIDTSERNPLIGTLALAAYAYGGGAVLAPDLLKSILTKLHLHGLISGIEPTQRLAHWMSHGQISEAISASATYWQSMVAGGNLDKFFVEAVHVLKEDPGEIAIIAALALGFGYSLTKIIPSLGREMGDFPFTNYAALGGKGGAAIYDTIMHPGDDWFLGTCKWLCKSVLALGKLIIAPFFEGYSYGVHEGFIKGLKKSGTLLKNLVRHTLAATLDFGLALLTVPLIEVSALVIHVPFRGLTKLVIKTFGLLGHICSIGDLILAFAKRAPTNNMLVHFRISPLYGFNWPFGHFSNRPVINLGVNIIRTLLLPPLELLKNLIFLPIIDAFSFSLRLAFSVLDPLSRIFSYAVGRLVLSFGTIWDSSIGLLFSSSARGITSGCNWMDKLASSMKHSVLASIESTRSTLHLWAFAEDDLMLHISQTDMDYYISDPRRYELIPHSESHCLIQSLLNNNEDEAPRLEQDSIPSVHHHTIFSRVSVSSPKNSTSQNHPLGSTIEGLQ